MTNTIVTGSIDLPHEIAVADDIVGAVQVALDALAVARHSLSLWPPPMLGDAVGECLTALRHLQRSTAQYATTAHASADRPAAAAAHAARIASFDIDPVDVEVYDRYFGLRRAPGQVNRLEVLAAAMPSLTALVASVSRIALPRDYGIDLLAFLEQLLAEATPGMRPATDPFTATAERRLVPSRTPDALSPMKIWTIGHQAYGLANRAAAAHLDQATHALATGDMQACGEELRAADVAVAAITASMMYAATLTRRQYASEVRPSMAPPILRMADGSPAGELTGGMNVDHAEYRRAIATFVQTYARLDSIPPEVQDAADAVLHRDLHDIAAHQELTYRLVGAAAALDGTDDGSAIQALRRIGRDRLQHYSSLLRLGRMTRLTLCPDTNAHLT